MFVQDFEKGHDFFFGGGGLSMLKEEWYHV